MWKVHQAIKFDETNLTLISVETTLVENNSSLLKEKEIGKTTNNFWISK